MAEKEISDVKEVISTKISVEENQTSTESLSRFPLYTKNYSQTSIEITTSEYTWTIDQFKIFSDTVPILRSAPFPESGQFMIQINFPTQADLAKNIKLYVLTKEAFTGLCSITIMYPPEKILLSKTKLGSVSNMTLLLEIPISKFGFHCNSDTHNSDQINQKHSNKLLFKRVQHNNDSFGSPSCENTSSSVLSGLFSTNSVNSKSNSNSDSNNDLFGQSSHKCVDIPVNSKSNSNYVFGQSSHKCVDIPVNSKSNSNYNVFDSNSDKSTFSFNIPVNSVNSNSNAHNSDSLLNTLYNKLQCIVSCKIEVYQQVLCNTLYMNLLPSSTVLKLNGNSTLDEFDIMNEKSIKFIVEKEQYVIQKKLLYATNSNYFKNICLRYEVEKDMTNELQTNNEIEAFKQILLFIMTGSQSVESYDYNTFKKLLITADKYNVPTLKLTCEHYLLRKIEIKNAVELMQLALLYNAKFLKMDSIKFIKFHIKEIVNTEEFKNLSQKDSVTKIMELIQESQLEVSTQKYFFTANNKYLH